MAKQIEQICECHPDCNPNDYIGRAMILKDEGWHNWYFNTPKTEKSRIEFSNEYQRIELDRSQNEY